MHEMSVASAVVDTAISHAAGRRVSVVTVRLGTLRQVVPASLEFYFAIVARDSVVEGARLEQLIVDARLRCRTCELAWDADTPAFRCPACAGADVEVVCGDELMVESIEVEEQSACTA